MKRTVTLGIAGMLIGAGLNFALPAASPAEQPATPKAADCPSSDTLVAYCGMPSPEDMEVLPDGNGLIVGEMGIRRGPSGIVGGPGTLKRLDPATHVITPLYPAPGVEAGKGDWGDPSCPGEIGADMNAHGIHLSRRRDGAWQLLVVNHGARESVEFFELTHKSGKWGLRWRGCAIPPPPNRLNDVVGLPGGGFLVTTMHREGADTAAIMEKAQRGENTGFLWRWVPGEGFSEQPGSASPRPNGVQIDAKGKFAYINTASHGGEVWKLDLARGTIVGKVSMSKPDNGSWSRDGKLLVTGITRTGSSGPCFVDPSAPCGAPFEVYAIDPATMVAQRIFAHDGPPVGGGTVAVQYHDDLFIGSFAGDRVLDVKGFFGHAKH